MKKSFLSKIQNRLLGYDDPDDSGEFETVSIPAMPALSEEPVDLEPYAEYRRSDRVNTRIRAKVYDNVTFRKCDAEILDLSQGGVRVESGQMFASGHPVTVKIYFPGHDIPLRIPGSIRWSRPGDTSRKFETGIRFASGHLRGDPSLDPRIQVFKS
jgi:hypothetical protein